MKTFEIYFNDLNEKAQNELLEMVGVDNASEMNWDMDIIPIATFDFEGINNNSLLMTIH